MPQELIDILLRTAPDTDISKVTAESRLKADLGLTSLDFIMIMFEIQDKYDVTFTGEEAFETVGDVIRFLQEKTGN
jgi:acyl carrier protein